jgi:type VI secretion system secreted protein VgrG
MPLLSKIDIEISGKPLRQFLNANIKESIYGIDSFEISCRYSSIEKSDRFLIENAKDLLGLPITIQTKVKIGNNEKDSLVFKGIVTQIQGTKSGLADKDIVVISGGSMEMLLNGKPGSRAFMDKTLEDIVKEVLKPYTFKNLGKKIAPRNKFKYPYIVQYGESDLEFLKRLSVRYGEWFFFSEKDIIFGDLPKNKQNLTIGFDLKDFTYQLRVNPVNFSFLAIDPLKRDLHKSKSGSGKADPNLNIYGKHALKESKKLFSIENIDYYENLNVSDPDYKKALDKAVELDEISDAVNLSDLTGSSTNPLITPGVIASVSCPKLDGSGNISYLSYLITTVQHSFDNLFSYRNTFTAIPAESNIPENTDPRFVRLSHEQIGRVVENEDPEHLGRVRVNFWWMENSQIMTPWIKVVTPYTQDKSGFYFVPAVNSRVLVGFEGGDVEKPYCIGAFFDKTHPPDPAWAGDYNKEDSKIQAIRTVSGQTIEMHDDSGKEKIRIYDTNNKNEITLDTANGEITIKATEKLTLEAKDIEIKAQNGIKVEAGQALEQKGANIKIEAQQGLEQKAMEIKTEAQTTLEEKATSVEIKANASLKATGSATAEISSSGIMTVKGSMVMIN